LAFDLKLIARRAPSKALSKKNRLPLREAGFYDKAL
jgi:hypothetical protein